MLESTLIQHSSSISSSISVYVCLVFFLNQVWDMQKKCVRTLTHEAAVNSVVSHPSLPVLMTGTDNGAVHVWSSTNFR